MTADSTEVLDLSIFCDVSIVLLYYYNRTFFGGRYMLTVGGT